MSTDSAEIERMEEERRRQREHERHMRQLEFNEEGQLSREFIESIVDTSKLQTETVAIMQNYLDRNWIFSNLTEAETHDKWHKLEVMKHKVLGRHPPQESSIRGPIRAYLFDDRQEDLQPLSPDERSIIDSFFDSCQAIVTRGRDGFERKQINTTIAESKTDYEHEENSNSGGLSLFS